MSIQEKLADQLKAAMKGGDKVRLGVLRMVRSRIQEAEVAARAKKGRDHKLGDEDVVQVITAYAKQRRDSIDGYRQGGREEMAVQEEAELAVLQEYLPKQLSEDEVRAIVQEAVTACNATSAKDMGAVMGKIMPQVKGVADGKLVNQLVREALAGKS
jgi:uncharacterized protein YqeY